MTRRANEQIYNNCTEGKKIIYVSSLGGVLPPAIGVSHECRGELNLLKDMPNLTVFTPETTSDVFKALTYAIAHVRGSSYIRLRHMPSIDRMIL